MTLVLYKESCSNSFQKISMSKLKNSKFGLPSPAISANVAALWKSKSLIGSLLTGLGHLSCKIFINIGQREKLGLTFHFKPLKYILLRECA